MAGTIRVRVEYDVPYSTEATDAVVAAVAAAAEENYARIEPDPWTPDDLPPPVDLGLWRAAVRPEALSPTYPPGTGDPGSYSSDFLHLRFSPVSAYGATVIFSRERGGRLGVVLLTEGGVLKETRGWIELADINIRLMDKRETLPEDEELDLMRRRDQLFELDPNREVAHQNAEALLHIVAALRAVYPVDELVLDKRLQDPGPHISGEAYRPRAPG